MGSFTTRKDSATYCRLLDRTIRRLRGEKLEPINEVSLQLRINLIIPENYLSDMLIRMDIHRKIAAICTQTDAIKLKGELNDRFGKIPESVQHLIQCSLLKTFARSVHIDHIQRKENRVIFKSMDRIRKVIDIQENISPSELIGEIIKLLKAL